MGGNSSGKLNLCSLNSIGATPSTPLRSWPVLLTSRSECFSVSVAVCRLKRPQPQGQCSKETPACWNQTLSLFPPLSSHIVFYSTSLATAFLLFFPICAVPSSLSSCPATSCMYIYKSAHNWCLGRSKEQRGREAIRGIKRGAASQPSFTRQWSKSNWVLFCGRTHTYVNPPKHTQTPMVTVLKLHTVASGTDQGWEWVQWTS